MRLRKRLRLAWHVFLLRPLAYRIKVRGTIVVEDPNTRLEDFFVDGGVHRVETP